MMSDADSKSLHFSLGKAVDSRALIPLIPLLSRISFLHSKNWNGYRLRVGVPGLPFAPFGCRGHVEITKSPAYRLDDKPRTTMRKALVGREY